MTNGLFSVVLGLHIASGTVALLSLALPFLAQKGGLLHRRAGWVFTASMSTVGLSAWILSTLRLLDDDPGNDLGAYFLAYVGLFSTSSVWLGIRSLKLMRAKQSRGSFLDGVVAGTLFIASLVLGAFGISAQEVLMMVFATFGLSLSLQQLRFLRATGLTQGQPILMHFSSMGNGAISAVTAFFVVNVGRMGLQDYELFFWIGPGLLGGLGLTWMSVRFRAGRLGRPLVAGETPGRG